MMFSLKRRFTVFFLLISQFLISIHKKIRLMEIEAHKIS